MPIKLSALAALAACLWLLGGYRDQGRVYPLALDRAHARLLGAEVPVFVFGGADIETETVDQGSRLLWRIKARNGELMHFAADLTNVSDTSTRVQVTLEGPTDGPNVAVGKRLESDRTVKTLYVRAMEEEVASKLEARPFDVRAIWPALAAASAAHVGQISADMDRAAEADRRRDRANIEKAYAEEAARR